MRKGANKGCFNLLHWIYFSAAFVNLNLIYQFSHILSYDSKKDIWGEYDEITMGVSDRYIIVGWLW